MQRPAGLAYVGVVAIETFIFPLGASFHPLKRWVVRRGLLASALLAFACGPSEGVWLEAENAAATAEDPLYVATNLAWPQDAPIPVCWLNPLAENAAGRAWVQEAIEAQWEAHSGVRFSGWGACAPTTTGVRIRIEDTPSGPASFIGAEANTVSGHSMVLNFTFANWAETCRSTPEFCIKQTAVHEFGHVLGFVHEQNRPDRPSDCQPDQFGFTPGTMTIGDFDRSSVMNYCNTVTSNGGQLSSTDVIGVQRIYGLPSPWKNLDVGSVGSRGTAWRIANTLSVRGSGADIGGTRDAFHFAYQLLSGDGTVITRVSSVSGTSTKAGLMIRAALSATAPFAAMVATPRATAFASRDVAGRTATTTTALSGEKPVYLKVVRAGSLFTGYRSSNGVSWTKVGSRLISMDATVYVGLAVASRSATAQTAAIDDISLLPVSDAATHTLRGSVRSTASGYGVAGIEVRLSGSASATTFTDGIGSFRFSGLARGASYTVQAVTPGYAFSEPVTIGGLPGTTTVMLTTNDFQSGWSSEDIGAVGAAGSVLQSNGYFVIYGAGNDIGGSADAFHFVSRSLSGDGQLTARVYQQDAQFNPLLKTGLVLRESNAANARNAGIFVTPSGVASQSRQLFGGPTTSVATQGATSIWLRVARSGDVVTLSRSPDGANWEVTRAITLSSLATNVRIGLAQSSHTSGVATWGMYDRVVASQ